jgi:hypothetical protein
MRPGGAPDVESELGGQLGAGNAADAVGAEDGLAIVEQTTQRHAV